MGGNHLSHEEMSLHEEQYGLGGAILEDQLFNLQTDYLVANMSQTSSSTGENGGQQGLLEADRSVLGTGCGEASNQTGTESDHS